jgi:hypothetical protein
MEQLKKRSTIVYVDGFNLYRRALQNTPYKWLNLSSMLGLLFPEFEIISIKYFTARISPLPNDTSLHLRQETYLRALRTIPKIELHFGKFEQKVALRPVHPWETTSTGELRKVKVKDFKEKGSDVNLCAHLMHDALKRKAEIFLVLTSDSDQLHPLQLLSEESEIKLGLIIPNKVSTKDLMKLNLPIVRRLREGIIRDSQFPAELEDNFGRFHKPESW